MCGRFDLAQSNREIDELIRRLPPGSPPVKRGEIFPTNYSLALLQGSQGSCPEALAWGFPRYDGKGVIINARSETALKKPMFKKALFSHPAAIPTTGFYEWRADPQSGRKQKFLFTAPDSPLLWLAGMRGDFPADQMPHRFTILTTAANPSVSAWHDRMPVLLADHEVEPWLRGENRNEILDREPPELIARPV